MATKDWYPTRISDRIAWHANWATQTAATGVADGLGAAMVTNAGIDGTVVAALLNYRDEVQTFAEGFAEYLKLMLDAPVGTATPPIPLPPAALTLPAGALPNIGARTRLYANVIKAAPGYTAAKGDQYGIVGSSTAGPGTPKIKSASSVSNSLVTISLDKSGFDVLVVQSRRNGGDWEQIGVSQTATFTDGRPPLNAGSPEEREYRVQGMVSNQPTGTPSDIAKTVAVP